MESNISLVDPSLVCTLPDDELALRRKEVRQFVNQAKDVQWIPSGLRFTFESDMEVAHSLVDFVLFETQCCNAVRYELRSSPPHLQLVLELHAPEQLLDALRALYVETGSYAVRTTSLIRSSSNSLNVSNICRTAAPFGAALCSLICIGLPAMTAFLGVLGFSFLRSDKVLLPIEVVFCAAFICSFWQGYKQHRNVVPLAVACIAASTLIEAMFMPKRAALPFNLMACIGLIFALVADRRDRTSHWCNAQSTSNETKT